MPKLILIDDHSILRAGARALVERHIADADIAEAGSLKEAVDCLKGGFDADLAILDMILPDSDGDHSIMCLRADFPSMPVIVLSGSGGGRDEVIARGAAAFVAKNGETLELVSAIQAVLHGRPYVPGERPKVDAFAGISDRQRTLLTLCGAGLTNKEIGRELGISDNTVRSHLAMMFRRFGIKSRNELARIAESGL